MKELNRRVVQLERAVSNQIAKRADPETVRVGLENFAQGMSLSVDQLGHLSERFLAKACRAELLDERTRPDRKVTLFLEGLANAKASKAKVYRGGKGALR